MLRILTVVPRYLPGYKGGGPIRTIANMIDWLGDEFQFMIVTADRDSGDESPYPGVRVNEWQIVGKAQVCYVPPPLFYAWSWPKLLNKLDYDVLYLNGFFAPPTRHVLWLRRLGRLLHTPVILAPRGEFSVGALALKPIRKKAYLWLARQIAIYRGVVWQASSEFERNDIYNALKGVTPESSIRIAPNFPAKTSHATRLTSRHKEIGVMRMVFLSRISRKKNLDFALDLLRDMRGQVEFDIYGPLEDMDYWQECQTIITDLPPNIKVTYKGVVKPEESITTLAPYHLFFLPTRGENFGHAILEAFRAGCPVLISDQTPWRGLSAIMVGWDVCLAEPEQFKAVMRKVLDMSEQELTVWSEGAIAYGDRFVSNPVVLETNRRLFLDAAS
jgi:glycosyltransferase involved in cell wall biosynthesis